MKNFSILPTLQRIVILICLLFSGITVLSAPKDLLKSLPIQDGGRIKPFDTFSREMLEVVYGKPKYEDREAYEIVLTWMLSPEAWKEKPIFEVRNFELLERLGMDKNQRYFKGDDIFANPKLQPLMVELEDKRKSKEKLNPYFQALQRLENQFFVFREIATGRLLRLLPPKGDSESWVGVADFDEKAQKNFLNITQAFIGRIGAVANKESAEKVDQTTEALNQTVIQFEDFARAENPALYPKKIVIDLEVFYNQFHPFQKAYFFYLLSAMIILLTWVLSKTAETSEKMMKAAWGLAIFGFLVHTFGFALRVYIMDRAPVTNMYETVIWVSWGSLLFAFVLEAIYKFRFVLFAGTLMGVVCLIIANSAPAVLDASLQPLEPVLRSNYWLTIHVMTITISYAAFLLAFGLGDVGLIYFLRGEEKYKKQIQEITTAIYRSIQIGVIFLAPGIVLGGIWADYSWGRFWGWDPKETWALIALLGYIAVLHARLSGMIKSFGMIACGVITFSLVIMAWYGVNFVLGAGLHSYGFGAGGVEYVTGFVLLHFALVTYVWFSRKLNKISSAV